MNVFIRIITSSISKFTAKTIIVFTVFFACFGIFIFSLVFGLIVLFTAFSSGIENIDETKVLTSKNYINKFIEGNEKSTNKVLSININGVILASKQENSDLLSFVADQITYGYEIKNILKDAAKDNEIKAILLEINSPGGTVTGAQAIFDGINDYKRTTNKPVYAHVQGLSASGAVWATSGSDKIYADTGSFIGSIGVISGPYKYYDKVVSEQASLFTPGIITQNGIETFNLSSGQYKDFGNPYRKMSEEETRIMQQALNNTYDDFVNLISTQRKIPQDKIKNTLKALIYDNKQAKEYNLIDDTANRELAISNLLKSIKVENDDYQIINMKPKLGKLESLLSLYNSNFIKPKTLGCIGQFRVMVYYGDLQKICN